MSLEGGGRKGQPGQESLFSIQPSLQVLPPPPAPLPPLPATKGPVTLSQAQCVRSMAGENSPLLSLDCGSFFLSRISAHATRPAGGLAAADTTSSSTSGSGSCSAHHLGGRRGGGAAGDSSNSSATSYSVNNLPYLLNNYAAGGGAGGGGSGNGSCAPDIPEHLKASLKQRLEAQSSGGGVRVGGVPAAVHVAAGAGDGRALGGPRFEGFGTSNTSATSLLLQVRAPVAIHGWWSRAAGDG